MPPLPPLPPSVPPPTRPPVGPRAARRPSVEHITLGAVLAVVVLGAAGWLLLKPASSSASAVRPRSSPAATSLSPTALRVTPTAASVTATRTTGAAKPTTGKALTKVAYLKAGNAVCAALHKNIDKLGPAPEGKPLAAYLTKLVRLAEGAQVRLGALRAPAGDAARLRQIRTRFTHLMALDRRLAGALAHDDEQQLISLSPSVSTASTQLAAAYRAEGLTACG